MSRNESLNLPHELGSVRSLFASVGIAMSVLAVDGRILDANQEFCLLVGRPREALIDAELVTLGLGEDVDATIQALGEAVEATTMIVPPPLRIVKGDGSTVTIQMRLSQLRGTDDILAIAEDVTAAILVQRALEEQSRLHRMRAEINLALARGEDHASVLQNSAEALFRHLEIAFVRIWTIDETGEELILRASAGMYRHLNGPHGRVKVGRYKIGRIAKSRTPHLTNDVLSDTEISDPDWAKREGMVAFAGYPMILEGELLGVLATFSRHPITPGVLDELASTADGLAQWVKRKRAEASLNELADRLESLVQERTESLLKANERLETFTYTVAHDLRQQIRGISLNANFLVEEASESLGEHAQYLLKRLIYSSTQLAKLTDDLLRYTRLGHEEPVRDQIDVTSMIHDIVEHIRENRPALADFTVEIEPDLTAFADPTMVRLAFSNLLENAFKFAGQKGQKIKVGREKEFFFVRDNGVGFDPAYAHKLFQPMERLHNEQFPGTGIGLANVRRIAEKHGGFARAEGAVGEGATFFVCFE